MFSFYLFWCLGYLALHFWLSHKWPNSNFKKTPKGNLPPATLIIPFRNEQANAHRLIHSLTQLSAADLRIFLVDDHSEDDSFALFKELTRDHPQFKLIQSPGIGKKAALDYAISQVQTEVILTSDADCIFQDSWVEELRTGFEDAQIQLVAGPVITSMTSKEFFQAFQQLEWCSILLLTQVGFVQRNPLMCSGANLSFRKSGFEAVGGYEGNSHFLSGDDEFLLKKVVKKFGPKSCRYLPAKEALVMTSPQESWRLLLNQRIRWAGKWKLHQDPVHTLTAMLAFATQLVWLGAWVVMWFFSQPLIFILGVYGCKILAEKLGLGKVAARLGIRISWPTLIFTSFIHPVYVIGIVLGSFAGKVTWKGRKSRI